MIHTVDTFINRHKLLKRTGLQLVTLSGGADSVALLLVLTELGYKVEAVHCNFHLRGEESNRDELFCSNLCKTMGVKLHIVHFDTKAFAGLHGVSIEMAARDLRYSYFSKLKEDIGAESICVAHHKDDLAETVLMNLIRGTGVLGLTGIRPRNGDIIRPLLCISRKDIENFLTLRHQNFITDSSNLIDDVTRNKIRLNIIPLLQKINPSVTDAITETAQHVNDTLPLIEESTSLWISHCSKNTERFTEINIKALQSSPSPNHILYAMLSKEGVPPQIITNISGKLDAQTGTQWTHNNKAIIIDRGKILIGDKQEAFHDIKIPMEGSYLLSNGKHLNIDHVIKGTDFAIDRNAYIAQMDAETILFPLTVRRIKEGDRFIPFGMKGTKLVSDFLTDRKVSLLQKQQQLCLTDATGNIVWLIGHRISNNNKIGNNTIKVIRIRYL